MRFHATFAEWWTGMWKYIRCCSHLLSPLEGSLKPAMRHQQVYLLCEIQVIKHPPIGFNKRLDYSSFGHTVHLLVHVVNYVLCRSGDIFHISAILPTSGPCLRSFTISLYTVHWSIMLPIDHHTKQHHKTSLPFFKS